MIQTLTTNLDETVALGVRLGCAAALGDVFALDGELGAGKTQLVRGIAAGLGLDPAQVSSPTFVLMHEYLPEEDTISTRQNMPALPLVHIDAYRLHHADELEASGYDTETRDTSVTAIEWAGRIDRIDAPRSGSVLQANTLWLRLEHRPEGQRLISATPTGTWRNRLTDLSF